MSLRSVLRIPAVAALLSFLLPGLGQAALGAFRRAAVVAAPAIATVLLVVVIGRKGFEQGVFQQDFLVAVLILDIVALGYHVWAIADAYFMANRPQRVSDSTSQARPRRSAAQPAAATFVLGLLIVATVGVHGFVAATDVSAQNALNNIFDPNGPGFVGRETLPPNYTLPPDPDETPTPEPTATAGTSSTPGSSPSPTATALPLPDTYPIGNLPDSTGLATNWADDGMLNLLMLGVDQGNGGNRMQGLRTDTMILLQVKISTGQAAMYGIPRNLQNVPLPKEPAAHYANHAFPQFLYALWLDAVNHPSWYPYYPNNQFLRGITAVEQTVGVLTGVRVDGTVLINLAGFIYIVDALGGIDINVPKELKDTQYPILEHGGTMTIDIKAGQQHMNGTVALQYARSRKSTDDYDRMRRQQMVLRAIREKVNPCSLLPQVPSLLNALGQAFWTDMPISDAPRLVALAQHVGTANVKSYSFAPADIGGTSNVITIKTWNKIKSIVAHGLDTVPAGIDAGSGGSSSGGGLSC